MNIQVEGITHLCQPFLYNSSVIEKTNVDKGPLGYIKKHRFIEIYFHRVL